MLAGCDDNGGFSFENRSANGDASATLAQGGEVVERDVEAPEVFGVTEAGLWDGRPSLGGVWVAHPDVTEPERVLIKNTSNGKTVVGALFRRERDIPGPRLQVSSEAAAALGALAGAPVELSVVALRKETVQVTPPASDIDEAIAEAPEIEAEPLDPIAATSAAIDAAPEPSAPSAAETETAAAEEETEAASTTPAPAPDPAPAPAPASTLARPYIQIGIFSVEANADEAANRMRSAGLIPTVRSQESAGKSFWRVVVGPASNADERSELLQTIQGLGFSDAYAVAN